MFGFSIKRKRNKYSRIEKTLLNHSIYISINAEFMNNSLSDYSQKETLSKELEIASKYLKQASSQSLVSKKLFGFINDDQYYKASIKGEIRKRVYEISKEIGGEVQRENYCR